MPLNDINENEKKKKHKKSSKESHEVRAKNKIKIEAVFLHITCFSLDIISTHSLFSIIFISRFAF